ncbi:TatD family hydrolase [Halobacterium bonnevillei]|uniref:Deoxyribonuclease n=1 Tax=Halobacterium bonnevillei TaxID=2692200 RepID=A0A6B0SDF7_9EURY|nr:TatD family hydrolase [Halobacterium bonnevillei]MXR19775.1 deoxyribonuclease [Halobacterium bonnevillei]
MTDLGTPVLDNHLHLDAENRGIEAVEEFARSGGTHLLVVNKPSWHLGAEPDDGEDFRPVFEETLGLVSQASDVLEGCAWPVLGVHPALISQLVDDRGLSVEDARDLMCAGIDVAAEYAEDGRAVALKSGRPHYDVSDAVWDASNDVIRHACERAGDAGVALQLHTEATEDLTDVATWAEEAGLPPERVVKHYASGELAGVTKSVMCRKEYLETAVEVGEPFLMETDFVDDADRPGAVMGPKTVPRRVRWLREEGHDDAVRLAHVETPESVYGIDTEATLAE